MVPLCAEDAVEVAADAVDVGLAISAIDEDGWETKGVLDIAEEEREAIIWPFTIEEDTWVDKGALEIVEEDREATA